jgi:hypothetical protein
MMNFLKGKKTYIVGGLTILFAVLGVALGKLDGSTALNMVATALVGMGIRDALNN